ncbi:uncharacterized protein LOC108626275, partial [Ceratina calcarata]|uniref:Uncharacterized protein LOC108626275 n=1 Tax=Ceratina calcarata TaxID=156304 RepID=A0AAJ7J1H4_9HYME
MAEKEIFSVTKFDGTNFELCKYGVSLMLESQDLLEYVEGTDLQPDKLTKVKEWKEWRKRQSKTSVILLSSVEPVLHINLVNCVTPKEIWQKLHELYGDTTEDAKQRCWQQFYDFRITDGESVATQIEKFEKICRKLDNADDKPSDTAIMSKLLNSLPARFSTFRMAWECTAREERKKENLIGRIIREDKRLQVTEEETSSLALQVQALQARLDNQVKQGTSGDRKDKQKTGKKKIDELKKKHPCNYCHEKGHWYRECKKRLADGKKTKSEQAYVCDISVFFSETTDDDESVWLADSGASMHMTFKRDYFSELGPVKNIRCVKIAGNKLLPVTGVGTINIQVTVNKKLENRQLTNVLLVPDLKRNLFSVGAITDRGFSFHSYHDRCEVRESRGEFDVKTAFLYGELKEIIYMEQPQGFVDKTNPVLWQ